LNEFVVIIQLGGKQVPRSETI